MSEADFGIDLSCGEDLDPQGTEVSGFVAFAQALVRRLDTPNGSLVGDDEGSYGRELAEMLSRGMTLQEFNAQPVLIQNQFLDDERVASAQVQVSGWGTETMVISSRVVASDGTEFRFTTDATTAGLRIQEGSVTT